MKLWKNEMKLRKKQIKLPKNFFVPRWRIRNSSEEIFDFLGGRVTVVGTHDLCVHCIKGYSTMALTRTYALPLDTRASLQPLHVSF